MSDPASSRLLVLDTSVAVKFYLQEELQDEARGLLTAVEAGSIELIAPSTIQPELWNALWQQHRRGELALEEARDIWEEFVEAPVSFFEIDPLIPRAIQIASSGVIVYDALFVALAEAIGTVVVTADGKLLKTLESTSSAGRARYLSEARSLF